MSDFDSRAHAGDTEGLGPTSQRSVLVHRFTLKVIAGPDEGREHVSTGERVVVGTHETAGLLLKDPAVSRFHCELRVEGSQVILRDLGSLNGTSVDGVRVLEAPLSRGGATVAIGRTQIRFRLDDDRVPISISGRRRFGLCVGQSAAMAGVFALLERAAASDATVLLEGETGTGKELAAESIHDESPRRDAPFVVVDCASIPRDLLESELFGHERGAFTGAVAAREGAFEAASGGTIFLDEIGELSAELQPKLLRALERREVKHVGSNKYVKVDVRIVAATNRNLRVEVNAQRFRSDLYWRLAVIEVRVPPLRERVEDIPLLVEHMIASLGARTRPEATMLRTPEFLAELGRHQWPGNVRELRNYVERCLALAETAPLVTSDDVGDAERAEIDAGTPLREAREKWIATFEQRYLRQLLEAHGDNVTAAARSAGVARNHLYRLLWRYKLR